MSTVIRISDETFSRLQNLAEPFIDTPAMVIDRLLDYYEGISVSKKLIKTSPYPKKKVSDSDESTTKLFLAPASIDDFDKTIKTSISLNEIERFLSKEEKENLQKKVSNTELLHCWAMTEGSSEKFNVMREGDIVLFTMTGSGKFGYYGRVVHKTDNKNLGSHLWGYVPKTPWRLIFFLEDIKHIDIDKTRLVSELGYKRNFVVPGITRVNQISLDLILTKYKSVENFLRSISN